MNSKDRVNCVFSGERPDRYPCYEHFWDETLDEWRKNGFPSDVDPADYFDFDIASCGICDLTAQYPEEFISEDEYYKVMKDSRCVVCRVHKKESGHTPQWLETPIKKPSDWWAYKERLLFNPDRIEREAFDKAKALRAKGKYICLFNADPYEHAWPVFGQVQIFMAMLEEPDVVKDALDTWASLTVECIDYYMKNGLDFDGCWFYGDMGYRNGTLFGPDVYRDLVMPAHSKIVNFLHENGKRVILHSCGQIKSFIPMLIEVGFDAIQPLEVKCDQDVRDLVKEHNRRIVFFGNMDVRALSDGRDAIEREINSKLPAFDGQWNYMFHSDHSIPQTVSLENYEYALKLAREYLGR